MNNIHIVCLANGICWNVVNETQTVASGIIDFCLGEVSAWS